MKTITIKQPWAHLICSGIKDIENRTWPTKFRGRVLVHAAVTPWGKLKPDSCFSHILTEDKFCDIVCEKTMSGLYLDSYPFGAIIGSVEIVDCVINHESIWAEKTDGYDLDSPIIHNWVLKNPIMFPEPIPAKGKLSFWEYTNILAAPEEENGELFCHCQIPVEENIQVAGDSRFGYYCRYCGGKWYK